MEKEHKMVKDKQYAIDLIKKIQNGKWDRNNPKPPTGELADDNWLDSKFSLGMEYGAIVVLMQLFNISKKDLGETK